MNKFNFLLIGNILLIFIISSCGNQIINNPINKNSQEISSIHLNTQSIFNKRIEIQIYSSYGNEEEVFIKGRVLKEKKISPSSPDDSSLKNLWRTIQLLESDEIKNISLDINFNGKNIKTKTDKEGHFDLKIKDFGSIKPGYNKVTATLSPNQDKHYICNISTGLITIQLKNDTTFGIISDIDDTIQISNVTKKVNFIKNIFFGNYTTQQKVKGTPELYQILDKKSDGNIDGDIYYLSCSPVNLYPRIEGFLRFNNFPLGSIDLKKLGFREEDDSLFEQVKYKTKKIKTLLETYPNKKFLCFGDSGEKDPEIYKQIDKEFPGRILGIYINNVTNENKNSPRFQGTVLTNNTIEAGIDLFQKNLITNEDLEIIKQAS